jgi:hypothetical protein
MPDRRLGILWMGLYNIVLTGSAIDAWTAAMLVNTGHFVALFGGCSRRGFRRASWASGALSGRSSSVSQQRRALGNPTLGIALSLLAALFTLGVTLQKPVVPGARAHGGVAGHRGRRPVCRRSAGPAAIRDGEPRVDHLDVYLGLFPTASASPRGRSPTG